MLFYEQSDIESVLLEREELEKKAPTDQGLQKRFITDQIAEGNNDKAILLLCEHLATFQTDDHSWMCLSDLYINETQYDKAAFCLEELVMKNPHTSHYHIRLAEIYYTWASLEHGSQAQNLLADLYQSAKSHYSHAVNLTIKTENGANLKALFGWLQASTALLSIRNAKKQTKEIKDDQAIIEYASKCVSKESIQGRAGQLTEDYLTNTLKNLEI